MTKKITIRPARVQEREKLEALQWRASLANEGDRAALLSHPDAIALPVEQIEAKQVFIAECNGTLMGFAVVIPREEGGIELDGLFVEPGLWRSGIGRTLIEHCCTYAGEREAESLYVIGNPHAQGFYENCGFEIIGIRETRFGRGLEMRKILR